MMSKRFKLFLSAAAGMAIGAFPLLASAHENYVLSKSQIDSGLADWSINVWTSLKSPQNILFSARFGSGLLVGYILYFFFQQSSIGKRFDQWMKKRDSLGETVLRVVLGISL